MRCPVCSYRAAVMRPEKVYGSRTLLRGYCPQCRAALRAVTGNAAPEAGYAWDIRDEGRHRLRLASLVDAKEILYLPPGGEEAAMVALWRAFRRRFGEGAGFAAASEYAAFLDAAETAGRPAVWLPPGWFPETPSLLAERMLKAALPGRLHCPFATILPMEGFNGK